MADAVLEGQAMLKEGADDVPEGEEATVAAATAQPADAPRERRDQNRGDRGDRRGGRGGRDRDRKRTTYVPPGAPPLPDMTALIDEVAPAPVEAKAAAAPENTEAAEAVASSGEAKE